MTTGTTLLPGKLVNLADIIDSHPSEAPAVICGGTTTSYGELRSRSARLRGGLRSLGVGPGEPVAVIASNNMTFVESYFAIVGLGAVMVPLNPTSPAVELQGQLDVVRPGTVILDATAARAWASIDRVSLGSVRTVIAPDASSGCAADAWLDELYDSPPVPALDVDADHDAVWMFTSGTCGAPNAARLTHGNLLSNLRQLHDAPGETRPGDVVFGVIPLGHIYGLNVVLSSTLFNGATLLLLQRFDPSTAIDSIRRRNVTIIIGVPPMWREFANMPDVPADAFAGVRVATSGAAPLPREVADAMLERYGVSIAQGYGLTEAAPVVTTSVGLDFNPGSVGRVLPGIDIRLVDTAGFDVPVGDTGEIWLRGANVFAGYLDPLATERVFTDDGWLRTGDIGTVDDDGNLYLVDRSKDLIIVSGFNVYPAEVEGVLITHPDIADAGVVGVDHPGTGEAVKAFVVPREGATLDEESVISWCEDHLARYKCPSKVLFVDQLPRHLSGKILRRQLN